MHYVLKDIARLASFIFAMTPVLPAAVGDYAWTEIVAPVSGRRLIYSGLTYRDGFSPFPDSQVQATIEYANVVPTAAGIRYEVAETAVSPTSGRVYYDMTEARELTATEEIALTRQERGNDSMYLHAGGNTPLSLTYTTGFRAPRLYEGERSYGQDNRIAGLNVVFERAETQVLGLDTVAVPAGEFRALRILNQWRYAGRTTSSHVWWVRNVGPVKVRKWFGSQVVEFSLVSANFPIVPGRFEEAGPRIVSEPDSLAIATGAPAQFRVVAEGGDLRYAWQRDGVALPGQTAATLTLPAVRESDMGSYRVAVSTAGGGAPVLSRPARLTVTPVGGARGKLVNLSVRSYARQGAEQLFAGFVLRNAAGPRRLLVRGAGPWLRQFSISDYCRDPSLALTNSQGVVVAQNGDWGQYPDQAALRAMVPAVGTFPFDAGSADAALIATVANGAYTAQVSDRDGGTALFECYDADAEQGGELSNLSVRAETRGSPLIAGFAVTGFGASARLLVRAVGPSLARFGVTGTMPNPTLRLSSASANGDDIATSDDWTTGTQAAEIRIAAQSVGAFPLDENSRDAAMIVTVRAGTFSAIIDAAGGGVALLEVYRLPE